MRSSRPPGRRRPQYWANILFGLLGVVVHSIQGWAAILHVPGDYPSIQAGLTAAYPGDIVLVAPGVYYESLTMKPGVHLHGQPGAILDGSQAFSPVVRALSGVESTAELSGFVIRRSQQAGIFLNQAHP